MSKPKYTPDDRDPALSANAARTRAHMARKPAGIEENSPQAEAKRIEASLRKAHRGGSRGN